MPGRRRKKHRKRRRRAHSRRRRRRRKAHSGKRVYRQVLAQGKKLLAALRNANGVGSAWGGRFSRRGNRKHRMRRPKGRLGYLLHPATLQGLCVHLRAQRGRCRTPNCRSKATVHIHAYCSRSCARIRRRINSCRGRSACVKRVVSALSSRACSIIGVNSRSLRSRRGPQMSSRLAEQAIRIKCKTMRSRYMRSGCATRRSNSVQCRLIRRRFAARCSNRCQRHRAPVFSCGRRPGCFVRAWNRLQRARCSLVGLNVGGRLPRSRQVAKGDFSRTGRNGRGRKRRRGRFGDRGRIRRPLDLSSSSSSSPAPNATTNGVKRLGTLGSQGEDPNFLFYVIIGLTSFVALLIVGIFVTLGCLFYKKEPDAPLMERIYQ